MRLASYVWKVLSIKAESGYHGRRNDAVLCVVLMEQRFLTFKLRPIIFRTFCLQLVK